MSLQVSTGKASRSSQLLEELRRGRDDIEFFWQTFLNRTPHPGQLAFEENANATINVAATSNRWGKTTLLPARHFRRHVYKLGAEPFYLDEHGRVNPERFAKVRYHTVHTAGEWETAALVWDEARKLLKESARLQAFFPNAPASKPPHIDCVFGGRWKFRTLGHDASGIDGNSFYLITIDEAGWIVGLEEMMRNVILVRVADVRGMVDIVGTFKPGVSRDFYKMAVKASSYTGAGIGFAHEGTQEEEMRSGGLDPTVLRLCREYGIPLDEYADAATEGGS